jgi:hypothetical protein
VQIKRNHAMMKSRRSAVLMLYLQLVLITVATAQPVPVQQPAAALPSIIEIPIRMSLDPLFPAAEQGVPQQAGNWRNWKDSYGIKTQYRAWRGPLSFNMRGDVLLVQAHVRYWIRAHKKVLGVMDVNGSCGVNEAPRQAIIGIQVRLGWGPDWLLRPEFRIMPTRFLDRCEMTIANIDVTPIIEKEFQKQLKNRISVALRKLGPRVSAIRQQAEQNWSLLQDPVQLGNAHWLLLQPAGFVLSPLAGHGDSVDTKLAVMMYPKLVTGSKPEAGRRPLPPLGRFYPRSAGLNLRLTVELDYADISRKLSTALAGQSFEFNKHSIGIEAVEIGGHEQEISVNARLTGEAAGTLLIKANVVFNPESQHLSLENLAYDYKPEDPFLDPQAQLFYGYIRKVLEAAANQQLQQKTDQWRTRMAGVFDQITPAGASLDMSSLQLRSVQISMQEDGVKLDGVASGRITLELQAK